MTIYPERQSISIHALLAESDRFQAADMSASRISIHALLAESDMSKRLIEFAKLRFLSTLSLRRATLAGPSGPAFLYNFYPRSPCGERRQVKQTCRAKISISIHALLAESDAVMYDIVFVPGEFLSTLSLRRATNGRHANLGRHRDFYPRSPCGERLPTDGLFFFGY